jgi:hypothetical protein
MRINYPSFQVRNDPKLRTGSSVLFLQPVRFSYGHSGKRFVAQCLALPSGLPIGTFQTGLDCVKSVNRDPFGPSPMPQFPTSAVF